MYKVYYTRNQVSLYFCRTEPIGKMLHCFIILFPRLKLAFYVQFFPCQFAKSSLRQLKNFLYYLLTHFWSIFPFYTPWRKSENERFFVVFRRYEMKTLTRNGLASNKESLSVASNFSRSDNAINNAAHFKYVSQKYS